MRFRQTVCHSAGFLTHKIRVEIEDINQRKTDCSASIVHVFPNGLYMALEHSALPYLWPALYHFAICLCTEKNN